MITVMAKRMLLVAGALVLAFIVTLVLASLLGAGMGPVELLLLFAVVVACMVGVVALRRRQMGRQRESASL
jgi:ABC-type uncharacterized transport system permease subunit